MSKKIIGSTVGTTMNPQKIIDKFLAAWVKEPTKPTYTATEVGADPSGTASSKVSEHNTNTSAHNDIRLLIEGLTTRLNTLANSDDTTLDQMAEIVDYIKSNRTLIESVTTNKVNVADIINNLTTNVSNKPLSAAQGVALKKLIDTLQTTVNNIKAPTKTSELTNDSGFVTETTLESKGYGTVKTVNYMTPDANGNINVEGGSGKENNSFELISSDTLVWNGNTEGKIIATNIPDPSLSYVCVSNVVPTVEELQKGGVWATTDDGGVEYPEPFTSSNVIAKGDLLTCCDGYILIATADGVRYTEGSDIDCTFPKAGIYFIHFGADGYTSKLTINDYTGFTKSILKMENLTVHNHDWYGKARNKGNTVRGDDNIHGGLVKVSDVVPKLAEVQKGGKIRRYDVVNGEITGDLIIENYLENPYTIMNSNNEMLITSGGIVMVKITNSGVYFRQDSNDCVHSLTIDGFTKFPHNVDKIPAELLPDNIGGGGVSSWNDLTDKPFGETTTTSNTLTWDGDMSNRILVDPLGSGQKLFCHISSDTPTIDDFSNGASVKYPSGAVLNFTKSQIVQVQHGALTESNFNFAIIPNDNTTVMIPMNGVTLTIKFPVKGVYLGITVGYGYVQEFTINGYKFAETKIDTLNSKYLPESNIVFNIDNYTLNNPSLNVITCNKSYGELTRMTNAELFNAIAIIGIGELNQKFIKPVSVIKGIYTLGNCMIFSFVDVAYTTTYAFMIYVCDDGTVTSDVQ